MQSSGITRTIHPRGTLAHYLHLRLGQSGNGRLIQLVTGVERRARELPSSADRTLQRIGPIVAGFRDRPDVIFRHGFEP